MRICVYCASSPKVDKIYFDATERLGNELARENIEVVFGGGAHGLMGMLADTILKHNGKIKGIMPRFMDVVEWGHPEVSDFEYTDTMHERKAKFLHGVDGLVALPGGTGTLEELLEAITLKRLGLFLKPIVILNTGGYYDPLKQMLEKAVSHKFMNEIHLQMWRFVSEPEEVIPAIKSEPEWDSGAINFALTQ